MYSGTLANIRSCGLHTTLLFPSNQPDIQRCNRLVYSMYQKSQSRSIRTSVVGLKTKSSTTDTENQLDLTFTDYKQAFRSKSTWEVLRAYLVFKMCAVDYVVDNGDKLMALGKKVIGKTLMEKIMQATLYGHFVAGQNETDIQPVIIKMQKFGVNSILDYSAEEDLSAEEIPKTDCKLSSAKETILAPPKDDAEKEIRKYRDENKSSDRRKKAVVRTYFYTNEAQCEKNLEIFLKSIQAVSDIQKSSGCTNCGFAAIKVTALGRPQLLMPLSEAIERVHQYVAAFSGKKGIGSVLEQNIKPEELKKKLEKAAKANPLVQYWFENMTSDSAGLIHVLPWHTIIEANKRLKQVLEIPDPDTGNMESLIPPLSDDEEEMFRNMMRRLHTVFKLAHKLGVRVMVDAEQTYFQLAISRITMEMMKVYNKESPIVFNTYQCYLKATHRNLSVDLLQAERQNFHFGAKLVRGAYMEQERARAVDMGYDDPVNDNFESTTEMYKNCMLKCLTTMKSVKDQASSRTITIMAATHNEDTVRFTIEKMKEFGITPGEQRIYFGQLYGMCDQISFPLGQSGYSVYKYVPYGPIAEVLPYLSRRAQENRGFLGKTKKERELLRKELLRRIFTFSL